MKKVISAVAGIAVLAGAAVALAAQPYPGVPYSSAKPGESVAAAGVVNLYVAAHHNLEITGNGKAKASRCSSKYEWAVAHVKYTRSGRWSDSRPNTQPGVKNKAKIQVTGVFTSRNGGRGTWQVVGCATKHQFKFKQYGG